MSKYKQIELLKARYERLLKLVQWYAATPDFVELHDMDHESIADEMGRLLVPNTDDFVESANVVRGKLYASVCRVSDDGEVWEECLVTCRGPKR
jgi:hypothetical protein